MGKPATTHLPYLDGWRGLAILLLLIGHFFPVPGINLGTAGVNLFFVLSGLLMARILFVDAVPIPIFYKRRIARIFPPVFAFFAIIVVAYLTLGMPLSWSEVGTAAAFVNNYFPGKPGAAVMPFGHIWSLCVEEHSYVLLSIAAIAVRAGWVNAKLALGALALITAAIGTTYWLTYTGVRLEFDLWMHSEVSAFGILLSGLLLLHLGEGKNTRLPLLLIPALMGFGLAMHWWSIPAPVRTFVGVGAFALAVNLLHRAPAMLHAALSFAPLRQLGLWSFSIYLWQQPFYLAIHRADMPRPLALGCAVLAGVASFDLIEKPARAYLNRKWAGAPAAEPLGVALPPGGQNV